MRYPTPAGSFPRASLRFPRAGVVTLSQNRCRRAFAARFSVYRLSRKPRTADSGSTPSVSFPDSRRWLMPRNRTWSCCFSIRRNVSRNAENRSRSRFAAETAPRFRLCARGELRLTELATGKTVAKVSWSLTIPANGTADAVLSVTVGKYGVYKLSGKEQPYGFQFGCAAPQRPASKESRHRFELGTSLFQICELHGIPSCRRLVRTRNLER